MGIVRLVFVTNNHISLQRHPEPEIVTQKTDINILSVEDWHQWLRPNWHCDIGETETVTPVIPDTVTPEPCYHWRCHHCDTTDTSNIKRASTNYPTPASNKHRTKSSPGRLSQWPMWISGWSGISGLFWFQQLMQWQWCTQMMALSVKG